MPADVSILIIAYNSEQQLGPCLRSVLDQRQSVNQQILILDNASPDNSAALVECDFPEVTLIRSDKNLGFAGGMNFLAKHADAEFILLLNPDTVILDHAIDRIVAFARANPGHGLYGGRTLKTDGTLEPSSCWGLPTLYSHFTFAVGLSALFPHNRFFDPESLGSWRRDSVREVGMITGCFLLLPIAVWKSLNGFDQRFFMYGEDADLAIRAKTRGFRPLLCPEAKLVHEIGKSSVLPYQKANLLFKGKATLIHVHSHPWTRRIEILLLQLGVLLRSLAAASSTQPRPWQHLWKYRTEWSKGYFNSHDGTLR